MEKALITLLCCIVILLLVCCYLLGVVEQQNKTIQEQMAEQALLTYKQNKLLENAEKQGEEILQNGNILKEWFAGKRD